MPPFPLLSASRRSCRKKCSLPGRFFRTAPTASSPGPPPPTSTAALLRLRLLRGAAAHLRRLRQDLAAHRPPRPRRKRPHPRGPRRTLSVQRLPPAAHPGPTPPRGVFLAFRPRTRHLRPQPPGISPKIGRPLEKKSCGASLAIRPQPSALRPLVPGIGPAVGHPAPPTFRHKSADP